LLIAGQEAVSVPAWRRAFMNRRSRRDDRQQRQDDSNRQKHEARHQRTIAGGLLSGDSNLSAQRSCFRSARETTASRSLSSAVFTREKMNLFIADAENDVHHPGCSKNEPAVNDERVAMAFT